MKKYKNMQEFVEDKSLKKKNPLIYLTGPHWKDRFLSLSKGGYNQIFNITYQLAQAGFLVLGMPVYLHPLYIKESGKQGKTVNYKRWKALRIALMKACDIVCIIDYRLGAVPIEEYPEVTADIKAAEKMEKEIIMISV